MKKTSDCLSIRIEIMRFEIFYYKQINAKINFNKNQKDYINLLSKKAYDSFGVQEML
jgi:hypothetical protein